MFLCSADYLDLLALIAVQTPDGFLTAQGFFSCRLFSQSELPSLPEFLIQFCYNRRQPFTGEPTEECMADNDPAGTTQGLE